MRDWLAARGASGPTAAHVAAVETVLKARLRRHRLESAACRDGTASYQFVFSGLKEGVPELQAELAARAPLRSLNVFLDRPGGLR